MCRVVKMAGVLTFMVIQRIPVAQETRQGNTGTQKTKSHIIVKGYGEE